MTSHTFKQDHHCNDTEQQMLSCLLRRLGDYWQLIITVHVCVNLKCNKRNHQVKSAVKVSASLYHRFCNYIFKSLLVNNIAHRKFKFFTASWTARYQCVAFVIFTLPCIQSKTILLSGNSTISSNYSACYTTTQNDALFYFIIPVFAIYLTAETLQQDLILN